MDKQLANHIYHVDNLLRDKQDRKLRSYLVRLEPYVIADILEQLEQGEIKTFGLLPPEIQAEVALLLAEHAREFIIPHLSAYTIARFIHFNDEDDAVDILQVLDPDRQKLILEKLRHDKRKKLEKLLRYDPETAGGLMDLNFIVINQNTSIADITKNVKEHIKHEKQSPLIIIVNDENKIQGYIPYRNLLVHSPSAKTSKLIHELPLIPYNTDQEKVLEFALQERKDVVGVVDEKQHILGIIRVQDLIRVVQEEATEDIFRFAGVSTEEDVFDSPHDAMKRRYKWLVLNVATAGIGSLVITHFEGTIAKMAILAAYMPMVAGLGGNAGSQALAVTVRGLSKGNISWRDSRRIIYKEVATGIMDGSTVGTVAGLLAFILTQSLALAFIIGFSLVIIVTMAGLVGSLIPLILKSFNVDPAVASSVFVTASIDVFGFLVFLGLATIVLL